MYQVRYSSDGDVITELFAKKKMANAYAFAICKEFIKAADYAGDLPTFKNWLGAKRFIEANFVDVYFSLDIVKPIVNDDKEISHNVFYMMKYNYMERLPGYNYEDNLNG